MKIGIFTDQRFINTACPTGVGKHIEKMVLGLANNYNHDLSMLITKDQLSNDGALSNLPSKVIPMSWHAASLSWILLGRPYVDEWVGDLDWVYCPKNDLISCRKIKYAVTIHGAHELDPAFGVPRGNPIDSVRRLRSKIQYQKIFETAHVVFTVSNWLKEFIESNFNYDPKKIIVVGNGVDDLFYESFETSFNYLKLANPYLLCLGGLNYLDGGDRVVALAKAIKRSRLPIKIKLAGTQHDQRLIEVALTTGVVDLLGYVPHKDLAKLMVEAALLYYPSRYETFGMGAAEAMAAGLPVVTSYCTAIPEIVGDCGIYVDPEKTTEVLEVIHSLLNDTSQINDLKSRGRIRAESYRWNGCIERLNSTFF